jgi:hypothetical protein
MGGVAPPIPAILSARARVLSAAGRVGKRTSNLVSAGIDSVREPEELSRIARQDSIVRIVGPRAASSRIFCTAGSSKPISLR